MTNSAGTIAPANLVADAQDRLTEHGTATFVYDANGDLESRTVGGAETTFAYDARHNLRQAVLPGGSGTIAYITDARDRRVGKSIDGTLVQGFLYTDQLNPVAELDGTGNVVSEFVYGAARNVPDYMVQGTNTYRFVVDHLGSVVAVVDSTTGAIVQEREYDAFGRIVSETTSPGFSQPFGFAGGLWDEDTGLIRFGARDYRPDVGAWVSKDPLRFAGGDTSLYTYAANDPVNLADPNGSELTSVDGACSRSPAMCAAAGITRSTGATARIARGAGIGAVGAGAGTSLALSGATAAVMCPTAGEVVSITGRAAFEGFSRAREFGIRPHKELSGKWLKGTGLESHHLIERRFKDLLGQRVGDMLAIPVTPGANGEHQVFTNRWQKLLPRGNGLKGITPARIYEVASEVYADDLEILLALGLL